METIFIQNMEEGYRTRSGRLVKKPVLYEPQEICEDDYSDDEPEEIDSDEEDIEETDDEEEEEEDDEDADENGNLKDFVVEESDDEENA